jgi:dsRNA-specific ribonuclease
MYINNKNLNLNQDQTSSLFILNEKNIYIQPSYIEAILAKYNITYKVKNIKHFQLAMTHTSYLDKNIADNQKIINKNNAKNAKKLPQIKLEPIKDPSLAIPLQPTSSEVLEFTGDSIIHAILAIYLNLRYPNEYEGFLTRLRTKIESSDTLAILASALGLEKYILISKYMEINDARKQNSSMLEDCFEAFIGALFKDSNFDTCNKFLIAHIEKYVDFSELLNTENNFKDVLLQYFHQMKWEDPTYSNINISGSQHNRSFTMSVTCRQNPRDDGEIVGMGVGNSKKVAEQFAAKQALLHFKVLNEKEDSDSEVEVDI